MQQRETIKHRLDKFFIGRGAKGKTKEALKVLHDTGFLELLKDLSPVQPTIPGNYSAESLGLEYAKAQGWFSLIGALEDFDGFVAKFFIQEQQRGYMTEYGEKFLQERGIKATNNKKKG